MKGREGKALAQAAPSADLLVCFPSRAHLALMPKPICSPARPAEPNKRHHRRKKSFSRGGGGGVGQSSPLLWTKTKSMGSEITEPTSPKVTCAGQIKVRPKTTTCRSWQSVMEEIEKIHTDQKQRKRVSWAETLGFKKEIMQFLTCLRSIRFDLRCFGSFSGTDIATEEDEEEDNVGVEEEEEEHHAGVEESDNNDASRAVFSKWFMVLQENQNNKETEDRGNGNSNEEENVSVSVSVPPPNALLLMRCRSAPAKSWLRERGGGDDDEAEEREKEKEKEKGEKKGQSLKWLMEEEKRKKEDVVVMRYDSEFYDISSDVVKETWIVGGIRDLMSRSRSSKR